ncbi:MAG: glycosyltransferase family 4 protein [Mycobacterium sp.]
MREFARMGHRAVILASDSNHLIATPSFDGDHQVDIMDGVEFCWIRTLKYRVAKSSRRVLSWLDFEWRLWRLPKKQFGRPDAVIVSSLSLLTIFNGLLLRWKYGCRLVFEIRDIWPLTMTEEGGFGKYNPFVIGLGLIERLGYSRADAIVGTMPNLEEHVTEVLGQRRKVHCIPMGVDDVSLAAGEPLEPEYEAKFISQGKFVVCHAGSIGITNALDTLFACARALQERSNIHFLIVGKGDLKAKYQELCADLPNITFAPAVKKTMVQSVLAHVDLLYFSTHTSSVWKYGQSLNKVIDYMLSGKPILASYSGYPSMINEAGCGSFVPTGDADALRNEILRYAEMPSAAREIIGKAGRTWLLCNRKYDRLAEDYLQLMLPNSNKSLQ